MVWHAFFQHAANNRDRPPLRSDRRGAPERRRGDSAATMVGRGLFVVIRASPWPRQCGRGSLWRCSREERCTSSPVVAIRTVHWAVVTTMGEKGRRGRVILASPSALTVWAMDHHGDVASGRRCDAPDERHTTDRQRSVAAAAAAAAAVEDLRRGPRLRYSGSRQGDELSSSSRPKPPKAARTTT